MMADKCNIASEKNRVRRGVDCPLFLTGITPQGNFREHECQGGNIPAISASTCKRKSGAPSKLSIWHVHDGHPLDAVACQFDQMGVMREENCLPVRTDLGAKLQGRPSARVVKRFHDVV